MLRSLDVLSKVSDESNQLLAGDEHLLRGIHAEAGACGVIIILELHTCTLYL